MMSRLGLGLGSLLALSISFGASEAFAFVAKPLGIDSSPSFVTPAAMCGRTCQSGGRYIQGPPSVCQQYGLNYCGPSGGGPGPGVGVVVPGAGAGIGVGPGGAGVVVGPQPNCRTITIRDDYGNVRRMRRCD
jgi:hypothetical protein